MKKRIFTPKVITKEWLKLFRQVDPATGCWNWTRGRKPKGYGQIEEHGKATSVHRVAYRVFKGEFDRKLYVLHKCDNPPCFNPDHLFLGTQKDNIRDCFKKGRHSIPKLSAEAREEIRSSSDTLAAAAKKHGVSITSAWNARRGKTFQYA